MTNVPKRIPDTARAAVEEILRRVELLDGWGNNPHALRIAFLVGCLEGAVDQGGWPAPKGKADAPD